MNELLKKRATQRVLEASACSSTVRLFCKGRFLTQNTCFAVEPGDTLYLSTSQDILCGGSDGYTRAPEGKINVPSPRAN